MYPIASSEVRYENKHKYTRIIMRRRKRKKREEQELSNIISRTSQLRSSGRILSNDVGRKIVRGQDRVTHLSIARIFDERCQSWTLEYQ